MGPSISSVSLCMIVKNEASHLAACLASARPAAFEMIVVDTGSTDDTVAIAKAEGALVLPFDFARVDFSAARNAGLARARGRFVLVLDADERLAPESVAEVKRLVALGGDVGYVVSRRNRRPGDDAYETDHAVRLFTNRAEYRYRQRVHETVDEAILEHGGALRTSSVVLDHLLPAADARARKGAFYLRLLLDDVAAAPDDRARLDFLAAEYHKLGRLDDATDIAARIVALAPDDPRAHVTLGLYLANADARRDLAAARRAFETALRLAPDDAEARALLDELPEATGARRA